MESKKNTHKLALHKSYLKVVGESWYNSKPPMILGNACGFAGLMGLAVLVPFLARTCEFTGQVQSNDKCARSCGEGLRLHLTHLKP